MFCFNDENAFIFGAHRQTLNNNYDIDNKKYKERKDKEREKKLLIKNLEASNFNKN